MRKDVGKTDCHQPDREQRRRVLREMKWPRSSVIPARHARIFVQSTIANELNGAKPPPIEDARCTSFGLLSSCGFLLPRTRTTIYPAANNRHPLKTLYLEA